MSRENHGGAFRPQRAIKARAKTTYDNRVHSQMESGVPSDDKTLNLKLCRLRLLRPKFEEAPMVVRPWPMLSYDDPQNALTPGRVSSEPAAQSNWLVKMPAAKYVGVREGGGNPSTFLLWWPGDQEARSHNPYRIFYFNAKEAHKAGEFDSHRSWDSKWNRLFVDRKGIKGPTALWFMQGQVLVNGKTDYLKDRGVPLGADPQDELVVIQVPVSAGEKLIAFLDSPKKKFDGDERGDPSRPFLYGDAVGKYDKAAGTCGPGLFITFFNPEVTQITKNSTWDPEAAATRGADKKDRNTYEVSVSRTFTYRGKEFSSELSGGALQAVFDRCQFWEDDPDDSAQKGLLYVPSIEEQCALIAQGFRGVPKLVQFAWYENPEFFTDEVNGIFNARKTVDMGGRRGPAEAEDEDGDELGDEEKFRTRKSRDRVRDVTLPPSRDDEFEDAEDGDERPGRGPAAPAKGGSRGPRQPQPRDDEFGDAEDEGDGDAEPEAESEEAFDDTPPAARPGRRSPFDADDDDEDGEAEGEDEGGEFEQESDAGDAGDGAFDPAGEESAGGGGDDSEAEDAEEAEATESSPPDDDRLRSRMNPKRAPKVEDETVDVVEVERKMREALDAAKSRSGPRTNRPAAPPTPPPETKGRGSRRSG